MTENGYFVIVPPVNYTPGISLKLLNENTSMTNSNVMDFLEVLSFGMFVWSHVIRSKVFG